MTTVVIIGIIAVALLTLICVAAVLISDDGSGWRRDD